MGKWNYLACGWPPLRSGHRLRQPPRRLTPVVVPRIPSPPGGDLHGVVAGCLALTHQAVRALGTTPGLDAEKVVGEALLLLRATGRDAHTQTWQDLYAVTAPLARPHTLAASLCRDPSRAAELAFGHVMLTDLGHPDAGLRPSARPRARRRADRLDAGRRPGSPTPVAPRRPEQHATKPPCSSSVRRSSLAQPVDLLRCSTQDVYNLTHAIMHGTDLGAWPLGAPRPEHELAAASTPCSGWLSTPSTSTSPPSCSRPWPMLGLHWTPTARLALDVVLRAHRDHGYLPGPGHDPASPGAESEVLTTFVPRHPGVGSSRRRCSAPARSPTAAAPPASPSPAACCSRRSTTAGTRGWTRSDGDPTAWPRRSSPSPSVERAIAPTWPTYAASSSSPSGSGLADGRAVVQATGLLRRGTALARYVASSGLAHHQVRRHDLPDVVHEQLDREIVDARR